MSEPDNEASPTARRGITAFEMAGLLTIFGMFAVPAFVGLYSAPLFAEQTDPTTSLAWVIGPSVAVAAIGTAVTAAVGARENRRTATVTVEQPTHRPGQ